MIESILKAGDEAGFTASEVFHCKVDRREYHRDAKTQTIHESQANRMLIRAFWENSEPVGIGLSNPDLRTVRHRLADVRAAVMTGRRRSFAHLLPAAVERMKLVIMDDAYEQIGDSHLLELIDKTNESLVSFPGLHLVRFSFAKSLKKVQLANSNGLTAKYRKTNYVLTLSFARDGDLVDISENRIRFSQLNPERLVARAFNLLGAMVDTEPQETANQALILSPEAAAVILNELADGFKLDQAIKRGKPILAAATVTLADHPLLDEQSGSVPFDDEGVTGKEKLLINKGMFMTHVSDIRTAFMQGRSSTGNGFRDERGVVPQIQFSNFYVKPGAFALDSLLDEAGQGVLVPLLRLKSMDRQRGESVFSAYGYGFKDREIGRPVHFYLKTLLRSFLLRVQKVSKELRFFQFRSNVGSPYLLLSGRFDGSGMYLI